MNPTSSKRSSKPHGAKIIRFPLSREVTRKLRLTATVTVVTTAIAITFWPITRVQIVGSNRLDAVALARSSGLSTGDRFLATRISFAKSRLLRQPSILRVRASRKLPATVVLTVVERVPVARLDASFVADRAGRVFAALPSDSALPALIGFKIEADARPARLSAAQTLGARSRTVLRGMGSFPQAVSTRLESMDISRAVVGELVGGMKVIFGSTADLVAKAIAAEAVLQDLDSRKLTAISVDVSVPLAPVVSPFSEPTPSPRASTKPATSKPKPRPTTSTKATSAPTTRPPTPRETAR